MATSASKNAASTTTLATPLRPFYKLDNPSSTGMTLRQRASYLSIRKSPPLSPTPQLASLQGLPSDVILAILEHLVWPHDYVALLTCCRWLYAFHSELYKTIVIGFARPKALYSLLQKLELDPDLCLVVSTVVFDDRAKPLQPCIPSVDEDFEKIPSALLENRLRDPIPRADALLRKIHHKLYTEVLPLLLNVRSIYFKRLHPLFLSPPLQHKAPSASAGSKLKDMVLNNFPLRQLREYQHDWDWPPAAIAIYFTHCFALERVVIHDPLALRSYWTPNLVANLSVIVLGLNLDNVAVELDLEDTRAMLFNGILRKAKKLKTLCIMSTWVNLTVLLEDCHFPNLEGIEWYGFRQKGMDDPETFHRFLSLHSEHLRHLMISHVAYCKGNWGFVIPRKSTGTPLWLQDDSLLPNLDTLRLHHWEAYATPQPVYDVTESERFAAAQMIADFILQRHSIVDVALTDFPLPISRMLDEGMRSTRDVKRAMFGRIERAAKNKAVPRFVPPIVVTPSNGFLGDIERAKAYWAFHRKSEYLQEAYETYGVLFEGTELEKSGFRPYLLPRKRGAKRAYRR